MAVQPFYGEGPHPLLWASSQDADKKITISGMLNRPNYCVIFIICI